MSFSESDHALTLLLKWMVIADNQFPYEVPPPQRTIGFKISMMFRITWEIRNVSNIVKEWNRLTEKSVGAESVTTDQGHVQLRTTLGQSFTNMKYELVLLVSGCAV